MHPALRGHLDEPLDVPGWASNSGDDEEGLQIKRCHPSFLMNLTSESLFHPHCAHLPNFIADIEVGGTIHGSASEGHPGLLYAMLCRFLAPEHQTDTKHRSPKLVLLSRAVSQTTL